MPAVRQKPAPGKRANKDRSSRPGVLSRLDRIEDFANRHQSAVVIALILIASLRIISTYTVFNHTSDEPAHIASGMEWLDQHVYGYEYQHPPLTRVMVAIGPYLAGARAKRQPDMFIEGTAILYDGDHYDQRLALARAGNLPFFWLACWMVFLWGRRVLGGVGAVIAVLIFTMIPTVLAHAGLATTDIGVTACLAAALYATVQFAVSPNVRTAAFAGVAGGLTVLSKFSALVYFPAAIALVAVVWIIRTHPTIKQLARDLYDRLPWTGLSLAIAFLIVWAGYRFSFGAPSGMHVRLPFPELYSGVQEVAAHNSKGHLSYLLGQVRLDGWWYFFPVVLAVKLPIALMALIAVGAVAKTPMRVAPERESWPFGIAIAIPAAMLAVAMSARINLGLRHILPMFPFLALIGAAGVMALARSTSRSVRWMLVVAIVWLCGTSLAAHPDYLPYFNAFAGDEPENIVVDSDLDWGQDIKRLAMRLRELNVTFVTFKPTIVADLDKQGFPQHQRGSMDGPSPGWNAVQISEWKLERMGFELSQLDSKTWPDAMKPTERVGHSILLYYVPPRE